MVYFSCIMEANIDLIESGGVTSPQGFLAGATSAGIKKLGDNALDLAVLYSPTPCVAAALFTANRIQAAPVVVSRGRVPSDNLAAVVVNSGCANACTGPEGMADAVEMAQQAAGVVGVSPEQVLVSSTGVIGERLPMEAVRGGIERIIPTRDGGAELAKAIMTTDTVPKETAMAVSCDGVSFTIGGAAKGSGMIHPDLATLLCFLTTDAAVELKFLGQALAEAAALSFNMVSIDGDTSPNDMMLVMANGKAGNPPIAAGSEGAAVFQQALNMVSISLARDIARDGEGATRLIEVTVAGAPDLAQARAAARTVVASPLVKAAIHGRDPNWGRIMAAVGRSGAEVEEAKIDLYIGDSCVLKGGCVQPCDEEKMAEMLGSDEVPISLLLNLGTASATAWGCDLSAEYVTINSEYTT